MIPVHLLSVVVVARDDVSCTRAHYFLSSRCCWEGQNGPFMKHVGGVVALNFITRDCPLSNFVSSSKIA